jgi:hypothetical protein
VVDELYARTEGNPFFAEQLAAGRTNAEIGAELYISLKTAGVHVSNILRKLGVSAGCRPPPWPNAPAYCTPGSPGARYCDPYRPGGAQWRSSAAKPPQAGAAADRDQA